MIKGVGMQGRRRQEKEVLDEAIRIKMKERRKGRIKEIKFLCGYTIMTAQLAPGNWYLTLKVH